MQSKTPTILALDFDGVICDGLLEYFQTAWRTYCQIWQPSQQTPPPGLEEIFYRLRPVIETGWEMPVLIRALLLGISEEKILQSWVSIASQLLVEENLQAKDIGEKLDSLRDEWIARELTDWLSYHRFYPGVIERLQQAIALAVKIVIITTKEGRFVCQLLQQAGIELPPGYIFGKELQRTKHYILRELLEKNTETQTIWFVEDRLKTLQVIKQQPELKNVRLFLADWGYNTLVERESVKQDPRIKLLSLSQFTGDFSTWP
ncbi:MAG: HAD family hydrolase [Oscillatoriaceae bacterium SKW80]|nr:HAD family hydrolase [Oscillatoriaceae bacterium SKYG93]MCX8120437.1 HAD family hydrolase [Oscillatoriaceae bacterium SKW80]MDW8452988.1 HAD family hydrolase [Oscillatoriaceae cyanobacterium SKYGB_i_bin93]HIK28585.1 HAD family hydrolase [Oscillatoriaceae cyanobacterium M7585_C2015_266]